MNGKPIIKVEGEIKGGTIEVKETKPKIIYSERETRLVVAWCLITYGIFALIQWSILTSGIPRPPYVVDLLLPAILTITGVYILRKKIPER